MKIDADPLSEFCNAFAIAQEPDHLQSLHDGKILMVLILLVKFNCVTFRVIQLYQSMEHSNT